MPFDGNGTFSPSSPQYPAIDGTVIYAADWNQVIADICAGLSNAVTRDGQSAPTANLPMGGKLLTGLGDGSAVGHSLQWGQVFGGTATFPDGTKAVTQNTTDNSTKLATTQFVQSIAFSGSLPGQTGNTGKVVTTDGTNASWSLVQLASMVSGVLPIANGGTGANTAPLARAALGSTTVGDALFTAADAPAAVGALGAGVMGRTIFNGGLVVTSGSGTAYVLTPATPIAAYAAGQAFLVKFHAASGDSPTLGISGVATPPALIKRMPDGTYENIRANEIPANHQSWVILVSNTQALVVELPIVGAYYNVKTLAADVGLDWGDAGANYVHSESVATRTVTIPSNAAKAIKPGFTCSFTNLPGASQVNFAVTTDTLVQAGSGSTGPRSTSGPGVVTLTKVAATTWMIAGNLS